MATWSELEARTGDKVADGARDEQLAGLGARSDPAADVDGDAGRLPVVDLALADVNADAGLQAESV